MTTSSGDDAVIPALDSTQPPEPTETVEPSPPVVAPVTIKKSGGSFWRELPFLVIIALVLALLIKTFLVQAFYIPSASMENTLQGGPEYPGGPSNGHPYDRVLVNKLVYDFRKPRRGEVIVFKRPPGWPLESTYVASHNPVVRWIHDAGSAVGIAPGGSSDFIKRVIGVPGDHVACCNAAHQITVNGRALSEPYIDLTTADPSQHETAYTPFTTVVPPGNLWVMGDHRDDSDDSRVNGPVPIKDVVGRAFVVIWPVSDWKTLPVPKTFKQSGLHAAGSDAVPLAGGALAVAPVAIFRGRRRKRRLRALPSSATNRA